MEGADNIWNVMNVKFNISVIRIYDFPRDGGLALLASVRPGTL